MTTVLTVAQDRDTSSARVLWLSNETPDVNGQGGQRRQFFQIESLAARGHRIHVISLAGPQSSVSVAKHAQVTRVSPRLRGRLPNPRFAGLRHAVKRGHWDAVLIAHTESWPNFARMAQAVRAPVAVDLHNVEYTSAPGWDEVKWTATTQRILESAALVAVCSEQERGRLDRLGGSSNPILVLPHGIAPTEWRSQPAYGSTSSVRLFGSFGWGPNQRGLRWFLKEVWPLVHEARPDLICEIAGTGALPTELPAAAVHVGRVADLQGFLGEAYATALPVIGGLGAPLKYVEAAAAGAPMIATPDGAPYDHDLAALVSPSASEWVSFLSNAQLVASARPRARQAREHALDTYSWSRSTEALSRWLDSQADRPSGNRSDY